MNRLEARVIRLESRGRNGWRACIDRPMEQWPDDALLGFLGEAEGWPPGHDPPDAELRAVASAAALTGEEGGAA